MFNSSRSEIEIYSRKCPNDWKSVKNYGYGCIIWYNENCYSHAWNCKSLSAFNFCYECARDLISFPVDQKYEIINENDKKNWKSNQNHGCGFLKPFFWDTLYIKAEKQSFQNKIGRS